MEFTLNVKLSSSYYVKLLLKILGALGIWVYFYRFWNILCRRFYRYPREIILRVGERVTPSVIYPIAFIGAEIKESKVIMQELKKRVAKELGTQESEVI